MKILLVILDKGSHINVFPLGIAYIASTLRNVGYDVEIYNQEVYHYPDSYIRKFLDTMKIDVIGIGIYGYQQYRKAISFCNELNKSKNKPFVVIGSHGPSAAPEYFLKKLNADIVVRGEGEGTFINVLNSLSKYDTLKYVDGITWNKTLHDICNTDDRKTISDIDSIPFPAWDLFPMEHYLMDKHISAVHTDRCFPMIASRGCPFNCSFCYRMYKGYRMRSFENIKEEMLMIKKYYNATHITFLDENLMTNEDTLVEFSEKMIEESINMKWNCMGRIGAAKTHILQLMKKAGCTYINYGIESLDQNVLDLMNKKQTVDEIYTGMENTLSVGIMPGLNIIWGNPGDTQESLIKNTDFLIKYNTTSQVRTIKPVTPYPGTKLFEIAIKKELLKDVDDFYNRYTNTDRMTVNFTDISDDEYYKLLFEANKAVVKSYYDKISDIVVDGFRKCYFENDINFRGPRHR